MTEYDFSPDAYKKYLETQNRIARWVDKTRRYAPSNPFVPATPAADCVPLRKEGSELHRRPKQHSSKHTHRRIRSEEPSLDRPSTHSASRSEHPRPRGPVRWNTVSDHRSGLPTWESVPHTGIATVPPQPAPRSRPLRSNTAPAHGSNYPVQDNYAYATNTLPNKAGAGRSSQNSSKRYAQVHNTPSKDTSTSKGSLLKRLLKGIISKSGSGKVERAKGRRRDGVRR